MLNLNQFDYNFDSLGVYEASERLSPAVDFSLTQNNGISEQLPPVLDNFSLRVSQNSSLNQDVDTYAYAAEGAPVLSMAGASNIGYYDMSAGIGVFSQVSSITAGGHTAIQVDTLSAAELSGLDALVVQNPSNGFYGFEYTSNLTNIEAAVSDGMILIINDRFVSGAATILPGGAGISFTRDFGADIEANEASALVAASGGAITDTSLDGGTSSWHGYADPMSLPVGAEIILTTENPNEIVMFSYSYGEGTVIYSTIPADFYLSGFGPSAMQAGVAALLGAVSDYVEDLAVPPNLVTLTPNDDVFRGTDARDIVDALDGDDVLNGGLGNDVLNGQGGNDTFFGSEGGDTFNGGDGIDRVLYSLADSGVTVNLMDDSQNTGQAAGDIYDSIEFLFGSKYDDELTMDGADSLLNGLGGNDFLNAGAGDDKVYGGSGDDILIGGEGNDFLYGQTGADVFVFSQGNGHDRIFGFEDGVDTLQFIGGNAYEGIGDFSQLIIYQDGNHTVIEYNDDSVTLLNFDATLLTAEDVEFIDASIFIM